MVEHFGGTLGVLDYPMHGKASRIQVLGGRIFEGLPKEFTRRSLSLALRVRDDAPRGARVTARER